jgi:hypothetical protein
MSAGWRAGIALCCSGAAGDDATHVVENDKRIVELGSKLQADGAFVLYMSTVQMKRQAGRRPAHPAPPLLPQRKSVSNCSINNATPNMHM